MELGIYRAVKVLSIHHKKEAEILRRLEYPLLPKMIDYTELDDLCFLVMEYIRGGSLQQYLDNGHKFTTEEVLSMGEKILGILSYLHSRTPSVYYGDLKPDNLMLTEDGALYLIDFGSAVTGYERKSTICYGTKGYAAPEQYKGCVNEASDIYALGRTLQTLLAKGKYRICTQYFLLMYFIWRCCRRVPEKRWSTAEQAVCALKKIKSLKVHVWKGTALGAIGFILLVNILAVLAVGIQINKPSLETVILPVISRYDSMEARTGGAGMRNTIFDQIEERLQRFLRIYRESEEQVRILLLLAGNSELQGENAKAEGYYRQMIKEKSAGTEEYSAYGLFLIRQGREKESRKLYENYLRQEKVIESGNEYLHKWKYKLIEGRQNENK